MATQRSGAGNHNRNSTGDATFRGNNNTNAKRHKQIHAELATTKVNAITIIQKQINKTMTSCKISKQSDNNVGDNLGAQLCALYV